MGGHNRTYPSLRWVGMDDEQIVWKSGSIDSQSRSRSDSAVRHNRERSMPDRLLRLIFSCVSLRVGPIFSPRPISRSIGSDGVSGRSTACLWAYGKRIVSSNHAKQSIL